MQVLSQSIIKSLKFFLRERVALPPIKVPISRRYSNWRRNRQGVEISIDLAQGLQD